MLYLDELLLKAISALREPALSVNKTGKVSKKDGALRTESRRVPKEKLVLPTQFCIMPSPFSIAADLNKPPLAGFEPR